MNQRLAVLGAEDEVDENSGERLRHDDELRPFRAGCLWGGKPRAVPWAGGLHPFGVTRWPSQGGAAGLAIYVTNSWFRALARDTVDTSSPQ